MLLLKSPSATASLIAPIIAPITPPIIPRITAAGAAAAAVAASCDPPDGDPRPLGICSRTADGRVQQRAERAKR